MNCYKFYNVCWRIMVEESMFVLVIFMQCYFDINFGLCRSLLGNCFGVYIHWVGMSALVAEKSHVKCCIIFWVIYLMSFWLLSMLALEMTSLHFRYDWQVNMPLESDTELNQEAWNKTRLGFEIKLSFMRRLTKYLLHQCFFH